MSKSIKYEVMIALVVFLMAIPGASYAVIGAEAANKSAETNYAASDPEVMSNPERGMIPPNQMYPQQMLDTPLYPGTTLPGQEMAPTAQMYPGTMPDQSRGVMMSQPQMYPQYGNLPQYGNGPNMPYMLSPYPVAGDASQYSQYPQYGQYPMNLPVAGYPNNYQPSWGQQMGAYPLAWQAPYGQGQYQMPWNQQAPGYPTQYGSADQVYNQAMQAYKMRDYSSAMAKLQELSMTYPQSDLADNAYYWMGEINYVSKNYPLAIEAFQTVISSYPTGNKAPDALVKMGYAYAEIREYSTAKSILNDVVAKYSSNKRIRDLAMRKLNELNNIY